MVVIADSRTNRASPLRSGDTLVYAEASSDTVVLHALRNGTPLPRSATGLPPTVDGCYDKDRGLDTEQCLAHAGTIAAEHGLRINTSWEHEGKLHVQLVL